jgi:hypothetical protein
VGRSLVRFAKRLLLSRRHKCVRRSVVLAVTNFLFLAGFIFALEIVIIVLGVGNIFLPFTHNALSFFTELFF